MKKLLIIPIIFLTFNLFSQDIKYGDGLFEANFVVDMFNRLNTQFLKCSTIGTIRADDPFLSTLKVYKAYQDPVALHVSYLQRQFGVLSNQLKGRKFDNLSFFMQEILNLLNQHQEDIKRD